MRHFSCQCGNILFFDNSRCVQCGSQVGYDPASGGMVTVALASPFKRCKNGLDHAVCNWVVPRDGAEPFCPACALNLIIPDLRIARNLEAWHKIEIAKRRILYTLYDLGLHPVGRKQDPRNGLAFDFLRPTPGNNVLTGHDDGIITLNVNEAEDDQRARLRGELGESYRTLIGHFRHEIGHYYWDRFFTGRTGDDPLMRGFREIFGDERIDYDAAIASHYANPTPAPPEKFISSYASAHPWEDWAETWAHYLHIRDGAETAFNFGLNPEGVPIPFTPFPREALALPPGLEWSGSGENETKFLEELEAWAKLAPALNEIVASLGHEAFYPFVFSVEIARKFLFVHYAVETCRGCLGQSAGAALAARTEDIPLAQAKPPRETALSPQSPVTRQDPAAEPVGAA
ncbi:MAG TPA: putative zinc-binding metallopeptidase [Chthoniobacteraceae bacterium]|jgi:hypothetical protein|nr:putative zinc-binding metallopeptidase [Chthoniobacteraceae bacterium]